MAAAAAAAAVGSGMTAALLQAPQDDAHVALRETPPGLLRTDEQAAAMAGVSFACAHCGRTLVPRGGLWRITVRPTPAAAETLEGPVRRKRYATCTAAFATAVADGTAVAPTRRRFLVHPENFSAPVYARDLHCGGCGRYLGYRVEDEGGTRPVTGLDGRPPYKLFLHCGALRDTWEPPAAVAADGGAPGALAAAPAVPAAPWNPAKLTGTAAVLEDAAAWDAVAALLPPVTAAELERLAAAAPPDGLERTARLLEPARWAKHPSAAAAAAEARPAEFVLRELEAARADCERGVCLLRSLAPTEEDAASHPHVAGLAPRNPAARTTVAHHVDGVRDSRYVSLSADLSVPLAWALPYGTPVVVVPRWAMRSGATILSPQQVLEHLRPSSYNYGGEDDPEVLRLIADATASAETLAVGPVPMPAVEALR